LIDSADKKAITLARLIECLSSTSIEEAYAWFGYDYEREERAEAKIKTADDIDFSDAARHRFVRLFAWRQGAATVTIKRFFNQVNTFYAEQHIIKECRRLPAIIASETNRLCLFRQGKHLGLRVKKISFGQRGHLPFGDPFRQFPWLYGVAPVFLEDVLEDWNRTIDECPENLEMAVVLTMAFIAIHPYSDANGRVGRLIFTWLCKRWRLQELWLNEAGDGELLRNGTGIGSTEYLMGAFMMRLGGGHNIVDPGGRGLQSGSDEVQFFNALKNSFAEMRKPKPQIADALEFKELKDHLCSNQHLRTTSPRFECLKNDLW